MFNANLNAMKRLKNVISDNIVRLEALRCIKYLKDNANRGKNQPTILKTRKSMPEKLNSKIRVANEL